MFFSMKTKTMIKYVEHTKNNLQNNNNSTSVFCNLTTSEYVSNKDKSVFDLQHFINFPEIERVGSTASPYIHTPIHMGFKTVRISLPKNNWIAK